MAFHKQFEHQMVQDISANGATILHNADIADFQHHRLFAIIADAMAAVAAGAKRAFPAKRLGSVNDLDNHLRRDIGLGPTGGSAGHGYM
ncbi:MAG: hypothetical protein QF384_24130 [Alphaproteobacteria bacterium]|jgi:hypothetical protein|nr:hypothetical protein [Alphaproteobacteria bacterium]MDP6875615.1 hypothetical protein [Alphaproteobacteria bacterium]